MLFETALSLRQNLEWDRYILEDNMVGTREVGTGKVAHRLNYISRTSWTAARLYAPKRGQGSGSQRERSHVDIGTTFLQASRRNRPPLQRLGSFASGEVP